MRLWTLHPQYLDAKGLTALWREALLARAVLQGTTRGYVNHPQLLRFRATEVPLEYINAYLRHVHTESLLRGYRFDAGKLVAADDPAPMTEHRGQLLHEWNHLRGKLAARSPELLARLASLESPEPHPLFHIVEGPVQDWEKAPG